MDNLIKISYIMNCLLLVMCALGKYLINYSTYENGCNSSTSQKA